MTIGLKGGPELAAFLQTLPIKLEKNVMRGAMRRAAKVVQDEAVANIPVDTGLTRKSMRIKTSVRKGTVKATLSFKRDRAYIANFIEYGTRQHWISVDADAAGRPTYKRKGKHRQLGVRTLNDNAHGGESALKINGSFVGQSVLHPGVRPKPFLRPAFDHKARAAVQAAAEYISIRLTKEGLNAPDFGLAEDDE